MVLLSWPVAVGEIDGHRSAGLMNASSGHASALPLTRDIGCMVQEWLRLEGRETRKLVDSPGDLLRYDSIGLLYGSSSLPYLELGLSSVGEP